MSARNSLVELFKTVVEVNDPIKGPLVDPTESAIYPSDERWATIKLVAERGRSGNLFSTEYSYTAVSGAIVPVAIVWDMRRAGKGIARIYYGIKSIAGGDDKSYPLRPAFLSADKNIRPEGALASYFQSIAVGDIDLLDGTLDVEFQFHAPWTTCAEPWDKSTALKLYNEEFIARRSDPKLRSHTHGMDFCSIVSDGNSSMVEFNVPYTNPVCAGFGRYELNESGKVVAFYCYE